MSSIGFGIQLIERLIGEVKPLLEAR